MFGRALSLGLGALALAHSAAAAGAPAEYNVTMSDTAAILRYSEPHNTTAAQGWNQSYTGTGWDRYDYADLPDGDSQHTTSLVGASVSVEFTGTGAYFHGSGDGSVKLEIDGAQAYAGDIESGVVGVGGLAYSAHTATLSLTAGTLTLTNVTLTTIVGGSGAVTIVKEITSLDDADNTNSQLETLGTWQENNMFCGSSANSVTCERYDCLSTNQVGAALSMKVPANASIAMMYGAAGSHHGSYAVILTPRPPRMAPNQTFSSAQAWLATSKLLYYASLDPQTQYEMRFEFLGGSGLRVAEWGKASFVVAQGGEPWSADNPTGEESPADTNSTGGGDGRGPSETGFANGGEKGSSGTPVGAIAGGVVGGVAAFALIGGLIWWCCRRRKPEYTAGGEKLAMAGGKNMGRKSRWRHSVLSDFEVDAVDATHQATGSGTGAGMADPARGAVTIAPPEEHEITPLPVPWPGDRPSNVTTSSPKSAGPSPLSPVTQSPPSQDTHNMPAPYSPTAYGSFSAVNSDHSVYHSRPADTPPAPMLSNSPFSDPAPMPLSPDVQQQHMYPPRQTKDRPRAPPQPPTIVTEAQDAGRVQVAPAVIEEQVPPRYNPAWADDDVAPLNGPQRE